MGLGSIPNASTPVNAVLSSSAFQIPQSQGTPIEQAQADQPANLQDQNDSVTISSKTRDLSSQSGNKKS
jgi:hypothetical protein